MIWATRGPLVRIQVLAQQLFRVSGHFGKHEASQLDQLPRRQQIAEVARTRESAGEAEPDGRNRGGEESAVPDAAGQSKSRRFSQDFQALAHNYSDGVAGEQLRALVTGEGTGYLRNEFLEQVVLGEQLRILPYRTQRAVEEQGHGFAGEDIFLPLDPGQELGQSAADKRAHRGRVIRIAGLGSRTRQEQIEILLEGGGGSSDEPGADPLEEVD